MYLPRSAAGMQVHGWLGGDSKPDSNQKKFHSVLPSLCSVAVRWWEAGGASSAIVDQARMLGMADLCFRHAAGHECMRGPAVRGFCAVDAAHGVPGLQGQQQVLNLDVLWTMGLLWREAGTTGGHCWSAGPHVAGRVASFTHLTMHD